MLLVNQNDLQLVSIRRSQDRELDGPQRQIEIAGFDLEVSSNSNLRWFLQNAVWC